MPNQMDYSFKGGVTPDAIIAAYQRKAAMEQEAKVQEEQIKASKQQRWMQIAELAGKTVSGVVEHTKMKQKRDFINTLADSLANQPIPNATTATVMGQQVPTASFDPQASDAMRSAVQLAPEKASELVLNSQFKDPLEQQKLELQKEKLDLLRAKLLSAEGQQEEKPNHVRQLFEKDGKPYAILSRVDKDGLPVVVPVPDSGGERGAFVKPALAAESTQQLADFETLESIANGFEKFTDEDLKEFVGPANARIEKAKLYTPKAKERAGDFYQQLQDMKNQIIYLRSGKQINESEYKRLIDAMPDENKNIGVFKVQAKRFVKTFRLMMENRRKELSKSYRNVSQPQGDSEPKGPYAGQSTDDLIKLLSEED